VFVEMDPSASTAAEAGLLGLFIGSPPSANVA
jgi:hypothetical protein